MIVARSPVTGNPTGAIGMGCNNTGAEACGDDQNDE